MWRALRLSLVVAFLFMPASALAATYYIDSVGGSDTNNGLTTGAPWKTFTNVNSHTFVAGDTIYLKRGDTFSNAKITLFDDSGAVGNPITFDAYGTGADPILDAGNQNRVFDIRNSASYITIQNLVLKNPSESGVFIYSGTFSGLNFNHLTINGTTTQAILLNSNATSSASTYDHLTLYGFVTGINFATARSQGDTFSNLTITASSTGMTFGGSSAPTANLTIDSSVVTGESSDCIKINNIATATIDAVTASNCGANGIYLLNTTSGVSITNSTLTNNTGRGLRFDGRVVNGTVATTTVSSNASDGILISGGASGTTLSNLTVSANGLAGLTATLSGSSDTLAVSSSTFDGNGTSSGSDGVAVNGTGGTVTISHAEANHNTNDGFGIHNAAIVNIDHATSTDNGVDGSGSDGDAFSWHDTASGTLSNSYAWDNKKSGITNNVSSSVTVYNSVFGYTDAAGTNALITLQNGAAMSFYNNTLVNPSQLGTAMDLESTSTVTVRNNLLYGFATGITKTVGASATTEDYDIVSDTGSATVSGSGFALGTHSTTTDPQLADVVGGDYHLTAPSVAVNAGTGSPCPTTDKDGITRQGICDIGAYEYIDVTAPIVALVGASTISQYAGEAFSDPGATATDDVDGSLTVTISGSIDTTSVGTYTLTYDATDAAGNSATPATRTVVVTNLNSGAPIGLISRSGSNSLAVIPTTSTTSVQKTPNAPAPALGLRSDQVQSVLALLRSFGVDHATMAKVQSALQGSHVPTPTDSVFTRDLRVGSTGQDVKLLQQYLNAHGFPLSDGGPGASGSETEYFGNATKRQLVRFQSAHGIVPAEGYFGPVTRAYLNSH